MQGTARHIWLHEIDRKDIHMRRISLTLRELSSEFLPPKIYLQPFTDATTPSEDIQTIPEEQHPITNNQNLGLSVIRLAATYSGVCVALTAAARMKDSSTDIPVK